MCIQCSRCLAVFGCRNNPYLGPGFNFIYTKVSYDATNCPANFNFVANCVRCYQ